MFVIPAFLSFHMVISSKKNFFNAVCTGLWGLEEGRS